MKPVRIRILLCSALLACGGGDSSNDDAGQDATQPDAGDDGGALDASPSDAGEGGGPILDACVAVDGGAPCDPAHIQCGTTECTVGSQYCCIANDAGSFTCDTTSTKCQGTMMSPGTSMYCDEAANCPDAQVCCGFAGSAGGYATACQPSCGGNAVQFCRGSAECASGPCVVQHCNGVDVQTCGGLIECPP